jgi:hypothetical protein
MDTWIHGHMNTWTHGYMDTWTHGYMDTWTHGHMDMVTRHGRGDMEIKYYGNMKFYGEKYQAEYGKRKARRFSVIPLPFTHCANGSLSFDPLLMKKQRKVIHLQIE